MVKVPRLGLQDIERLALIDRQIHAQIHRRDDVQHFFPAPIRSAAQASREEREARDVAAIRAATRAAVESESELQDRIEHFLALAETRRRRARQKRVKTIKAPARRIGSRTRERGGVARRGDPGRSDARQKDGMEVGVDEIEERERQSADLRDRTSTRKDTSSAGSTSSATTFSMHSAGYSKPCFTPNSTIRSEWNRIAALSCLRFAWIAGRHTRSRSGTRANAGTWNSEADNCTTSTHPRPYRKRLRVLRLLVQQPRKPLSELGDRLRAAERAGRRGAAKLLAITLSLSGHLQS